MMWAADEMFALALLAKINQNPLCVCVCVYVCTENVSKTNIAVKKTVIIMKFHQMFVLENERTYIDRKPLQRLCVFLETTICNLIPYPCCCTVHRLRFFYFLSVQN